MKRRLLAFFLCAAMVFSVCACGGKNMPSITEMAPYTDLTQVLSGDYAITEELFSAYFTKTLYDAGFGLEKITDRDVVQDGDIVKADYAGYKDGEAFGGGTATNQWIDVSNNAGFDISKGIASGGYIPGFTDGLLGAKIGEKTASDITFPAEYHSADLAGQSVVFEFTVHEIYVPITMETITDAYVAENLSEIFEVSTVEEFLDFVEEDMAYNVTMNYLIQNSTFDIPAEYIEERVAEYQAFFEEVNCQGIELEEFLSYYGYTLESIKEEWEITVTAQVKAELVFEKIVKEQKLVLDEQAHKEYVENVIAINNEFFPDADHLHKYVGAGNAQAGETYMKSQTAVREYIIENYRDTVSE